MTTRILIAGVLGGVAMFLWSFAGFVGRVVFVTALGVLAAIATNISYWNWYGFPSIYTAGYITMQLVGFLCAGLVIALVVKGRVLKTPA